MRDRTEAEIHTTVITAKKDMSEFTHTGRFWEYQQIRDILAVADPLARCVTYINASMLFLLHYKTQYLI